uniref:Secreted phosphoprotein 24 n=1 Tax=Denticeps clupeoides TaxID=299321 RepID=A0AAY4EFF1_9TELE
MFSLFHLCECLQINLLTPMSFPLFQPELASKADKALHVALGQFNAQYARSRLYRVSKGSVKRVVPMARNVHDLFLTFTVRETDCLKTSEADPQMCMFRQGFFAPEASCYSRVRLTGEVTKVIDLRCNKGDSYSSESSSEEVREEDTKK